MYSRDGFVEERGEGGDGQGKRLKGDVKVRLSGSEFW